MDGARRSLTQALILSTRGPTLTAWAITILLIGPAGACATSPTGPSDNPVAVGIWGGDHAGLTIVETGAHLEFDCAHGDISQPLMVDRNGNLSVDGVFVREHGGPIPIGEQPDQKPALYAGNVDGATMTLDVTLTGSQEKIGTFRLTYRASPHVVKCL